MEQSTELGATSGGGGLEHKLANPSLICSFIHHSFIQQVLSTHHVASIGVRHISDPNKVYVLMELTLEEGRQWILQ